MTPEELRAKYKAETGQGAMSGGEHCGTTYRLLYSRWLENLLRGLESEEELEQMYRGDGSGRPLSEQPILSSQKDLPENQK